MGGFKVSFESSNPKLALKITERLASLFVEENLRQREGQADGRRPSSSTPKSPTCGAG